MDICNRLCPFIWMECAENEDEDDKVYRTGGDTVGQALRGRQVPDGGMDSSNGGRGI